MLFCFLGFYGFSIPSAEAGQFLRRSGYTIAVANKGARATYGVGYVATWRVAGLGVRGGGGREGTWVGYVAWVRGMVHVGRCM